MLGARDHEGGKWRRRCVQKGGFRLSPKNWSVYYQPSWVLSAQIRKQRSLRLEAQDIALSRQVHEFESRRERQFPQVAAIRACCTAVVALFPTPLSRSGSYR